MPAEPTSQPHLDATECCSSILDFAACRTPQMARVRRHLFDTLRGGRAPRLSEIAARSEQDLGELRETLARLVAAGVATLEGDLTGDRAVVGADGLTVRPTPHRLNLDGRQLYTWCAFDTVGIPAALNVDAVATTPCGACSTVIELGVRRGQPPVGAVVGWWPLEVSGPVNEAFCPTALFFCNRSHLDRWRDTRPGAAGEVLTLAELADRGRAAWSMIATGENQR